jgi:hypothetical protein
MKQHNLKYLVSAGLLGLALVSSQQAGAAGKILAQADAVEAEKVEYIAGNGGAKIKASGCAQCPLTLSVDANTKFLHKGEPINLRRAMTLSGKPGTVIYDGKKQQVIRVRW